MMSEWRVTSNLIAGEKCYSCYRLKNVDAVDHGITLSDEEAVHLRDTLAQILK